MTSREKCSSLADTNDSPLDRLLSRLDGVRQSGAGKWRARCPAHGSKSGTLSIADSDGRVLMHCFAGCETSAVLQAVGLTLSDLFDKPLSSSYKGDRPSWSPREVIGAVVQEASIISLIAADLMERAEISNRDWERLAAAYARLTQITHLVRL